MQCPACKRDIEGRGLEDAMRQHYEFRHEVEKMALKVAKR